MKQLLIAPRLFVGEKEESLSLGTALAAAWQCPGTAPEQGRAGVLGTWGLLPALLRADERMSSPTEAPEEPGKRCTPRARRSDPHLLAELSLLEQRKGPS